MSKTVYRIYRTNDDWLLRYVIKDKTPGLPETYMGSASTKWGARRMIRKQKNKVQKLVEEL